ncbi:MAG TPA: DUF3231 family protein [Bacillales bacterium]|nr:DUF3231 family protein [Bacillales bacterium]
MGTTHPTKLTSAELSQLWANYQNDTMEACVFKHFLETVEDPDIASVIERALEYPRTHIPQLKAFFDGENWPVPQGLTESDVNLDAPRLFSDSFMLYYLDYSGIASMNFFGAALAVSTREDVRRYFSDCLKQAIDANHMTTDLLLQKGLYIRPPYLTPPTGIDFVTDRKFLGGWLGENRPLISMEITNLFANMRRNNLGKALLMGFSQVAGDSEVEIHDGREKNSGKAY